MLFARFQVCSGSESSTDTSFETEMKQRIRDEVPGASDQFIDDFAFILTKIQNNSVIYHLLSEEFVSRIALLEHKRRIHNQRQP